MNAEQLKNSILQRAVEGKLVEQREEEGTAAELLREIKAEKARLVKEGKLKKEKPLPEIKAEEIPFEIPESWEWVRLNDLVCKEIKRGKSPVYAEKGTTLVFAQKCNTKEGKINLQLAYYLDEQILGKYPNSEFMQNQDIIINSTGIGTLGRIGILTTADFPSGVRIVPDSHVTVVRTTQKMSIRYLFYMLKRQQPYLERMGDGSTKQKELKADTIKNLLVPLPPLDEQKRIVAKIEELLPHVEQYGKAHDELTALNEKFPDAMKKSVLQYAMEGKLVEQREEEGTAKELLAAIKAEKARLVVEGKLKKEKPLPEIKAEEIPFEIPESWEWVRIGDIFTTSSGTTPSKSNPAYYQHGIFNWVRTTDLNNGVLRTCAIKISSFAKTECKLEILPRKSVCIAMYGGAGTIGKNALIDFDTTINQSVFAIHPNGHCEMKYILYFIQYYRNKWMDFAAGSRKDPNINGNIIKNTLFPLPPLAEQKRIVAKIEELLACCGALEKA